MLLGARATLLRDKPLFTVESFPHSKPAQHKQLMALVHSFGYTPHEVPESCGLPSDCRNYLALPMSHGMNATNPCAALFEAQATAARLLVEEPMLRGYKGDASDLLVS